MGLVLASVALFLMNGQPDASVRWNLGAGIATALLLAYLIGEIVWMARNQGRPSSITVHYFRTFDRKSTFEF